MLWAMNWVPEGWTICDGRSLSVNQYQALYSLIGNTYGGNNVNFNLPDLRGRAPISYGQGTGLANNYVFGRVYGTETSAINVGNLPPHTHTGNIQNLTGVGNFIVSTNPATDSVPNQNSVLAATNTNAIEGGGGEATVNIYGNATNTVILPNALKMQITGGGSFVTGSTGGGVPIANIPPVISMTWAMCTSQGLYPVRP